MENLVKKYNPASADPIPFSAVQNRLRSACIMLYSDGMWSLANIEKEIKSVYPELYNRYMTTPYMKYRKNQKPEQVLRYKFQGSIIKFLLGSGIYTPRYVDMIELLDHLVDNFEITQDQYYAIEAIYNNKAKLRLLSAFCTTLDFSCFDGVELVV